MLIALPAGYLADKWSRKACIRMGSFLQVVASLCLLFAALIATPGSAETFTVICIASCIQGVSEGILRGPTTALMEDSCPAGRRSDLKTASTVIFLLASSMGPLLGIIVFIEDGNSWTIDSMRWVIVVGIIIGLPANLPLCRMDDRKALGGQSEAVHMQQESTTAAMSQTLEARELATRSSRTTCCGLITVQRVRFMLFVTDLILSTAAGMTVKFFPLFFAVECNLSPVTLQILFASLSLLVALGSLLMNRISKGLGRMQVIIPCFAIGITCTLLLGSLRSLYQVPWVMILLFLMRCSMMWSVNPLQNAIKADYTIKSQRARWKAIDTVSAVGFSGSAALGGFLIDRFGYGLTFVITGWFQATVIPLWILLSPLVAKESELLAAHREPGPPDAIESYIPTTQDLSFSSSRTH